MGTSVPHYGYHDALDSEPSNTDYFSVTPNDIDENLQSFSTKQEDIDLFFQPPSGTSIDSSSSPLEDDYLLQASSTQEVNQSHDHEINALLSPPGVTLVNIDQASAQTIDTDGIVNSDYEQHIKTFPGSTSMFWCLLS